MISLILKVTGSFETLGSRTPKVKNCVKLQKVCGDIIEKVTTMHSLPVAGF